MNDKPRWLTFEQLLEMDDQRSIVGSAMVDFVVDFAAEPKGESAIEIARQRWQQAELITGNEANHE